MRILLLILPVVAARAFSSPEEDSVTASKVNKLVSDFVELYFEGAKKEAWSYTGMKTAPVQMKDVDVKINVSNLKQYYGVSLGQSQSSYLSENEFATSLSVTAAKMSMGGDIEINGTVKGQPINKSGKITITVDTLTPEVALKANHDDHSVTLIDYECSFEYSEPKIDLDVDFNDKELIANAIRNVMKEEVEQQLEQIKMSKTTNIAQINRLSQHYNLEKIYQLMEVLYKFVEALSKHPLFKH